MAGVRDSSGGDGKSDEDESAGDGDEEKKDDKGDDAKTVGDDDSASRTVLMFKDINCHLQCSLEQVWERRRYVFTLDLFKEAPFRILLGSSVRPSIRPFLRPSVRLSLSLTD